MYIGQMTGLWCFALLFFRQIYVIICLIYREENSLAIYFVSVFSAVLSHILVFK